MVPAAAIDGNGPGDSSTNSSWSVSDQTVGSSRPCCATQPEASVMSPGRAAWVEGMAPVEQKGSDRPSLEAAPGTSGGAACEPDAGGGVGELARRIGVSQRLQRRRFELLPLRGAGAVFTQVQARGPGESTAPAELADLISSIREIGLLQPVLVEELADESGGGGAGRHHLVAQNPLAYARHGALMTRQGRVTHHAHVAGLFAANVRYYATLLDQPGVTVSKTGDTDEENSP